MSRTRVRSERSARTSGRATGTTRTCSRSSPPPRPSSPRWGHRLMERGGRSAQKLAIVATARKLAVLMFRLWKRDEVWKPLYNSESPSVAAPGPEAESPKPAVLADCARAFDTDGDAGCRRIDCSTTDGSDPSMHRTGSGPSKSANRSVGHGTTASVPRKSPPKRDRPAPVPSRPTGTTVRRGRRTPRRAPASRSAWRSSTSS